jgi:hypothetical protein
LNVKLAQNVVLGAWILIGLNLLMAFGSIWVFARMAPVIEKIQSGNARSLQACEEMLASLATACPVAADSASATQSFAEALSKARGKVAEHYETLALDSIAYHYSGALRGDSDEREKTVALITRLGDVKRAAMTDAEKKARQVGNAGAWGIVFMASSLFFSGMLFMRHLGKNLVRPFEEMHTVVTAFHGGDTMRRCSGTKLPKDIAKAFRDLNELLDGFCVRSK